MKLVVGICDDCAEQVELLRQYLDETSEEPDRKVVCATDPKAFLEMAAHDPIDIAFLDIDMKTMNGIVLGEKIKTLCEQAVLIYITAYDEYALEAFRVRAFHYLVKPLAKERFLAVFQEATEMIRLRRAKNDQRRFAIKNKGETLSVLLCDIRCFEKVTHKIRVHAAGDDEEYYGNFTQLLEEIKHESFIQCHQGFIVNIEKIRAFRDKTLFLEGGMQVPVSRKYIELVRESLAKRLFAGKDGA